LKIRSKLIRLLQGESYLDQRGAQVSWGAIYAKDDRGLLKGSKNLMISLGVQLYRSLE
jgi:hypothetical protein